MHDGPILNHKQHMKYITLVLAICHNMAHNAEHFHCFRVNDEIRVGIC